MNPKVALGVVCVVMIGAIGLVVETQYLREKEPPDLRNGSLPIGGLGHPLGSLVKIEGLPIQEALSHGACTLAVDTINGKKLAQPVEIWVEDVEELFEGTRYVLEGYENMKMTGLPPARLEVAKRKGTPIPPVQAGWGIHTFFVPLDGNLPVGRQPDQATGPNHRSPFDLEVNTPTNPEP